VTDYRVINRANWDEPVAAHVASPDYEVARFVSDPAFIGDVVRFDLPRLGNIGGCAGSTRSKLGYQVSAFPIRRVLKALKIPPSPGRNTDTGRAVHRLV
jgi:hypothetical protein